MTFICISRPSGLCRAPFGAVEARLRAHYLFDAHLPLLSLLNKHPVVASRFEVRLQGGPSIASDGQIARLAALSANPGRKPLFCVSGSRGSTVGLRFLDAKGLQTAAFSFARILIRRRCAIAYVDFAGGRERLRRADPADPRLRPRAIA